MGGGGERRVNSVADHCLLFVTPVTLAYHRGKGGTKKGRVIGRKFLVLETRSKRDIRLVVECGLELRRKRSMKYSIVMY
jgi:hypothetical protein